MGVAAASSTTTFPSEESPSSVSTSRDLNAFECKTDFDAVLPLLRRSWDPSRSQEHPPSQDGRRWSHARSSVSPTSIFEETRS